MGRTKEDKLVYFAKLKQLIETYPSIFIVSVDNVGSNQMHQIRQALRGKGELLMGKNTMVRRAVRMILADFPQFERFLPHVKGNVGFVFTGGDLKSIRDILLSNRVAAPAKAGAFAQVDVFVPAGNTGMEPGKTSFFQALNIPTKIARGTIEIVADIHLVVAGGRVGSSEATLLQLLNIQPFSYGMIIVQVYDAGQIFESSVLDIEESTLIEQFMTGVKTIAAISLALNYPTIASVAHSLVNSYKNVLAIALATEISFPAAEKAKAYLENPEAFAVAAAPVVEAKSAAVEKAVEKVEEKEESDDDMGFGLFD